MVKYNITMGTWSIKFRGKDGSQEVLILDAESKAAVFDELQRRGINALSIEETAGKKVKPAKPAANSALAAKLLVVGAIVVVGALVAWMALSPNSDGGSSDSGEPRKRGAIKEVTPNASAGQDVSKGSSLDGGARPRREVASSDARSVAEGSSGDETAESGDATEERLRPGPVFTQGTDQLISMATSVPADVPIPPLPVMSDADTDRFIETLSAPLEIKDDDSEDVRKIKEQVQSVRQEIANIMRDNPSMSLSQILNDHRDLANHQTECRAQVVSEINDLVSEGDIEGARRLRDIMNLALQQLGVPEVTMPVTVQERLEQGEDVSDEDVNETNAMEEQKQ